MKAVPEKPRLLRIQIERSKGKLLCRYLLKPLGADDCRPRLASTSFTHASGLATTPSKAHRSPPLERSSPNWESQSPAAAEGPSSTTRDPSPGELTGAQKEDSNRG